jgi:leader peptidase (prepilin peptidase)/N-methyltransferase
VRPHENIPLLSYLLLRGRCAGCRGAISIRYPIVELATALLFLLLWRMVALPAIGGETPWVYPLIAIQLVSLLLLIPVTFIDIDHYIIPDAITIPGIVAALGAALLPGGMTPLESVLGLLVGGGSLLLTGLLGEWLFKKKEAMGGGDIKLMAFLGAAWGAKVALLGIVLGSMAGAIIGGLLMALRQLREDRRIPFGPFLAIGTVVAVLFGDAILNGYFSLIDQLVYR